jgi:hypothetical protein
MKSIDNPSLIKSKIDFEEFMKDLSAELIRADWENNSIPTFLQGLAGAVYDSNGLFKNQKLEPLLATDWSYFARLLLCARATQ